MAIGFTPEELAEMAAYDAMVDAEPVRSEDLEAGKDAERHARQESMTRQEREAAERQRRYRETHKAEVAERQRRYRERKRREANGTAQEGA